MKRIFFYTLIIILEVLPQTLDIWCEASGRPLNPDQVRKHVYWYERGIKKRALVSMDEIALIGCTKDKYQDDASLVRQFFPKATITGRGNFVMYLKTTESADGHQSLGRIPAYSPLKGITQVSPVFYRGDKRNTINRMTLMNEIIVKYKYQYSEERIKSIEKEYSLMRLRRFTITNNAFLYASDDSFHTIDIANSLYESGHVEYAYPHWLRQASKRAVPDDPLFQDQWHLQNTGQGSGTPGEDVDIVSAWDNFRGSQNEVIAIVDYDGMEINHEDLIENIVSGYNWDFINGDSDPTPFSSRDSHGTQCAGIAAGRGFNTIGICGTAPYTGLVGYRIPSELSDVNESMALSRNSDLVDIYSNSWGPYDPAFLFDTPILDGPGELVEEAIEKCITDGRQGLGNIYVWAAGNGGDFNDNSNYDGYSNSRYTIAVAASTENGKRAVYSEKGANILVNAPGSSLFFGMTTTDLTGYRGDDPGNYSSGFSGTSASAPLVAGVAALVLGANPELGWRDVQHIFIETSEKNDPMDEDWTTNGAGYHINHKYGFGRVDAKAATDAAILWDSAPPEKVTRGSAAPNLSIPDNDPVGVTSTIFIDDDLKVEYVDIFFSASDHNSWGDLEIILTSPDGTESVLAEEHNCDDFDRYENWRFGSVRHYGESSKGYWALTVKDLRRSLSGTFESWELKIYGTSGSIPFHYGDVSPIGNRDGIVNVGDALVALRFALGMETPDQDDLKYGDVAPIGTGGKPEPDGKITVGDAIVILRKALGMIFF